MKSESNGRSVQRVLALAAVIAALGVSVGVPVEDAFAAQLPDVYDGPAPRARPVELAFSLVERPGQTQGTADSSTRRTEIAAFEAYRVKKRGMRNGSKQGMGDGSVRQGARPGTSMRNPGPAGRSRLKAPGLPSRGGSTSGRGGIGNRSVHGPGSSRMLNPQPLPPKGGLGAPGR